MNEIKTTTLDFVAPEQGLTANGKHSRTREEAWRAFEAACLEFQVHMGLTPKKPRTAFEKKYQHKVHRWYMFAKTASPNRGLVTVERPDRTFLTIDILSEKPWRPVDALGEALISETYPEERARQLAALSEGRIPTWSEVLDLEGWEEEMVQKRQQQQAAEEAALEELSERLIISCTVTGVRDNGLWWIHGWQRPSGVWYHVFGQRGFGGCKTWCPIDGTKEVSFLPEQRCWGVEWRSDLYWFLSRDEAKEFVRHTRFS